LQSDILSIKDAIKAKKIIVRKDNEIIDFSIFGREINELVDQTIERINYHTSSFLKLQESVTSRINNGDQAIYLIDAKFGGGKTHLLADIYRSFKSNHSCELIILDGHNIKCNTLWGEIASRIKTSRIVEKQFSEMDKNQQVPQLDDIVSLLDQTEGKAIILLLDEIGVYLKRVKAVQKGNVTLADLSLTFLHSLSVAVANSAKSVLVMSLSEEQEFYQEETKAVKRIIHDLRSILSRKSPIITPIMINEVVPIVNQYLFEHIDSKLKDNISEYYAKVIKYTRNEISSTYPFHPAFIPSLWVDYGSTAGFQMMRGILRVLTLSFRHSLDNELISYLPLHLPEVLNDLTVKIGKPELKEIIIEEIKRAENLGKNCFRIASMIVLTSILGKGISTKRIQNLAISSKTSLGVIHDSLKLLERNLWYLHSQEEGYILQNKPNINKLIEDEIDLIQSNEINSRIQEILSKMIESEPLKLHYFEFNQSLTREIPNVFILKWDDNTTLEDIITKNHKGNLRSQTNNIILLHGLKMGSFQTISRVLAAEKILKRVSRKEYPNLVELIHELTSNAEFELINGYNQLTYLHNGKLKQISQPSIIKEGITNVLIREGGIITNLSPEYLKNKILPLIKQPTVRNIHDRFLFDSAFKILQSFKVLTHSIISGIKEGYFLLKDSNSHIIDLSIQEFQLNDDYELIFKQESASKEVTTIANKFEINLKHLGDNLQNTLLLYLKYDGMGLSISHLLKIQQYLNMLQIIEKKCTGQMSLIIYKNASLMMKVEVIDTSVIELSEILVNNIQMFKRLDVSVTVNLSLILNYPEGKIITDNLHQVLNNLNQSVGKWTLGMDNIIT
jgi:hypothetical protein